jgi:nucleoside phosphorylase
LQFSADRIARLVKFDWTGLDKRRLSLFQLSSFEILELSDALREAADLIHEEHGIVRRTEKPNPKTEAGHVYTMQGTEPNLVIFVALREELEILNEMLQFQRNPGTPEAEGQVGGVSVAVICPGEMGRVPAAVSMTRYLSARSSMPKLILIVGLAGGFRESGVELGQIVCTNFVIDLATRKILETEGEVNPKFRRRDYTLNGAVSAVLQSDKFNVEEWSNASAKAFDWPKARRPSLVFGPLASVDEVVSSDDWRKKLLTGNDKLMGVEMEAGGVCLAAETFRVPTAMLRVVSDQADPSKSDDAWRPRGMRTLTELIRRLEFNVVFEAMAR